jgi:hypothetical protein
MADNKPLTGGCLCGAVRFEVRAPALDIYHCHCSICRKLQGALYPSYVVVPRLAFTVTKGADNVSRYDSSEAIHRFFCKTCGGRVFEDNVTAPDKIWYAAGSLDGGADPGHEGANERHIFWESRNGWYEPQDGLPKLTRFGGETSAT